MRIIGGSARGRAIAAPSGRNTRPTLDRVKESLFGILQFDIPSSNVLDLFSGSGNLGLEALSRGAAHAVLNDRDKSCAELIKKNSTLLGFNDRAEIYCMDSMALIDRLAGSKERFDVVFLDPPYESGLAQKAAERLFELELVADGGVVIIEHNDEVRPHDVPSVMCLTDTRRYGIVYLSFFRKDAP